MSSVEDLQAALAELRLEVGQLRNQLSSVQERLSTLEGRTPGEAEDSASSVSGFEFLDLPSESGYRVSAEREEASRQIGRWVRRALRGQSRGLSGRERITQSSRLYLVFKDFDLQVHDPPLVFHRWGDCREVVARGGQPGDSIFIGLPSQAEARIVCGEAGLRVPESLAHGRSGRA